MAKATALPDLRLQSDCVYSYRCPKTLPLGTENGCHVGELASVLPMRMYKSSNQAVRTGLMLAQAGEFAFVQLLT